MTGTIQVRRTFLEMRSPADLKPAATPQPELTVERLQPCSPAMFRYLYAEVGRAFRWTDRLSWTDEQIAGHLADPSTSIWLLSWKEAPAGYFELRAHNDRSVEIAYFG